MLCHWENNWIPHWVPFAPFAICSKNPAPIHTFIPWRDYSRKHWWVQKLEVKHLTLESPWLPSNRHLTHFGVAKCKWGLHFEIWSMQQNNQPCCLKEDILLSNSGKMIKLLTDHGYVFQGLGERYRIWKRVSRTNGVSRPPTVPGTQHIARIWYTTCPEELSGIFNRGKRWWKI